MFGRFVNFETVTLQLIFRLASFLNFEKFSNQNIFIYGLSGFISENMLKKAVNKKQKLLARKEELLNELKYYERRIEEERSPSKSRCSYDADRYLAATNIFY